MSTDLAPALQAGLGALGEPLDAARQQQLLDYVALLAKWNQAYNLTAVREPRDMLIRHVLDSLTLLPHLAPGRWLDVGSGPGLPGLVLAIARPELQWTLLDSNRKKTLFCGQAARALRLANVTVVHCRAEEHRPEAGYQGITTRAWTALDEQWRLLAPLLAPGGRLVAMKGRHPADEIAAFQPAPAGLRCEPLRVPGLNEERCVVIIPS
jgi:16S rRNA (guanine527-N7)-methyltransferase